VIVVYYLHGIVPNDRGLFVCSGLILVVRVRSYGVWLIHLHHEIVVSHFAALLFDLLPHDSLVNIIISFSYRIGQLRVNNIVFITTKHSGVGVLTKDVFVLVKVAVDEGGVILNLQALVFFGIRIRGYLLFGVLAFDFVELLKIVISLRYFRHSLYSSHS
jgi:hypothetical protein